jgi:hypothetical protein
MNAIWWIPPFLLRLTHWYTPVLLSRQSLTNYAALLCAEVSQLSSRHQRSVPPIRYQFETWMRVCVFSLFLLSRASRRFMFGQFSVSTPPPCVQIRTRARKSRPWKVLACRAWQKGCAGGETRPWKAKSRPSPHEIPRCINVSERKLTVQSILFSLVLTQIGKEQFNFTAIRLT